MLIRRKNVNLVIPRKPIHKGKNVTPSIVINDLINKRSRIIILRASMVNVTVINTDMNGTLFIIYRNNIGNPLCQGNQIDKTSFKKFLNFSLNSGNLGAQDEDTGEQASHHDR